MIYLKRENSEYIVEQRWYDKARINFTYATVKCKNFASETLQDKFDLTTKILKQTNKKK